MVPKDYLLSDRAHLLINGQIWKFGFLLFKVASNFQSGTMYYLFFPLFMIVCTKNSSKSLAIMAIKALKGKTFSTQGGHEQTTTMRIRVFTLTKFSMP